MGNQTQARRTLATIGAVAAVCFAAARPTPVLAQGAPPAPGGATTPAVPDLERRAQALANVPLDELYVGALPSLSVNTPTAYPAAPPTAFIVLTGQQLRFARDTLDGTIALGVDYPIAHSPVGIQAAFNLLAISAGRFGRRGSLDLMAHAGVGHGISVGVGEQNAIVYNDIHNRPEDSPPSYYGVVTKRFLLRPDASQPFSRLAVTAGLGSGRFVSTNISFANTHGINLFGDVAVNLAAPVNLFTEWTGQDMNIGLSIAPFPGVPFVITPAAADVTGSAGNGPRFIAAAGYAHRF